MEETLGLGKNEEQYILGFDLGYGDVKVSFGTKDQVIKKFKFPSVIGVTKKIPEVINNKIKEYNGAYFMVGEDAAPLPSDNIIDITEYKNLEYYAPLLLRHAIEKCEIEPDIVVSGLSIAQIKNSGYFQKKLSEFQVDGVDYSYKVYVLPQGAGCKLSIDKYFDNFPTPCEEFLGESNYIIADIGQSTIDFLAVSNGQTNPNLFTGIENEGLIKIATILAAQVKEDFNRNITLAEAKTILDTNKYRLRGKNFDYTEKIKEVKKEYLKGVLNLIEQNYGKILDKQDFIFLSGGGSRLFKSTDDNFIRIAKRDHEYYNSIGWWIYGCSKLND